MSKQSDLLNLTDAISVSGTNVGIGTSSPQAKLHIVSHANQEPMTLQATTDGYSYITYKNSAGADVAYTGLGGGAAVVTGTTADYAIRATANLLFGAGSSSERMRIDSAGRVTMPYQPAFHVYASTATVFTSLGKNLSLNNVEWNIGSHFSTANYRFTCPVAGLYYFYTSMNINSNSNPRRTAIGKNGVILLGSYFHSTGSDWIEANTSGTILCNANDYIEFYYQGTADVGVFWHYAGGYLVG